MTGEPRDHPLCLKIPQQNDAVVFARAQDLLPVRTERDLMNAAERRVAPGANRFFRIGIPDLDFPFRVAGDDPTVSSEQRTPDGAAVWELADDATGFRVPEPGRLINAGGQKGITVGTERGFVDLSVVAADNPTLAGPPVPEVYHAINSAGEDQRVIRADRAR